MNMIDKYKEEVITAHCRVVDCDETIVSFFYDDYEVFLERNGYLDFPSEEYKEYWDAWKTPNEDDIYKIIDHIDYTEKISPSVHKTLYIIQSISTNKIYVIGHYGIVDFI